MELKISEWKEFKVSDIFEKRKIKKLSSIPKQQGDIAFISSQSTNNGIVKFCKVDPILIMNNAITVSTNGTNFECFYHDYKFVASSDVEVLFSSNLTKNIALFICTILKKNQRKYSFGNKAKNNAVFNTVIKLPIDKNGNIDWLFMEDYIKSLLERERESSELIQSLISEKQTLDISKWKKFKIGDFFQISRGKRIVKHRDYLDVKDKNNIYPVITTKTANNAIDGYYSKYNCQGNVIISGGEASGMNSTYQINKCWILDRARIILPKHDFLNKYVAMFLITIFNKNTIKFSYGNSANPNDIENLIIKLPIDKNGEPDWKYMENYIKSLMYSKYL